MWERHRGFLLAYANRRLPSREMAEEAVSEAFATAWLHRRRVPEEPATRLWLTRATFHTVSNVRRTAERQHLLVCRIGRERPEPLPTSEDSWDVVLGRLQQLLAALPAKDRELVQLAMWEEMSHADIGSVLDLSAGNVAVRLHRVRARLRQQLDAREEPDCFADLSPASPRDRSRTSLLGEIPSTSSTTTNPRGVR